MLVAQRPEKEEAVVMSVGFPSSNAGSDGVLLSGGGSEPGAEE